MNKKSPARFIATVFVALILGVALFPFLWMILTALKNSDHTGSFKRIFTVSGNLHFLLWGGNSIIVALGSTLFSLIIAALGAFGLSRFGFRGKKPFMYIILMAQVLPGVLLIVPLYGIMKSMGLLNNLFGLVLANIAFAVPFCTWTMKAFFDGIPKSLDDAALVDGAGRLIIFTKIILPLAAPGLVVAGIFVFVTSWNEYLFASTYTNTPDAWTLPVGLAKLGSSAGWPAAMAGSLLVTLPVVFVFLCLQRHLVSGMTAGAAIKQ